MKKLTFISVLVVIIGTCFTVSAFADFYVIPVKKSGIKSAITVPKTGQTGCWDTSGSSKTCDGKGQDGEYQLGIMPEVSPDSSYPVYGWTGTRFTDNNDGTVTDNLTGLIWLKNANSLSGVTDWASALSYCNNLAAGGDLADGSSAGDWRLPNFNELRSLVDSGESNPALHSGHPFTNVQSGFYWSSTTYESYPYDSTWIVSMGTGSVYDGWYKDSNGYVWPVRSDN